MEIKKIPKIKSLTISKEQMRQIAQRIIKKEIPWKYEEGYKDYWLIIITPDGNILEPNKDITGHPEMARKVIYPNDKILSMLHRYLFEKNNMNLDNDVLKVYFMTFYGYIPIDGYLEEDIVRCEYNPSALTLHTNHLPESLKGYCDMQSTKNENNSGNFEMELSEEVPFFKRKIFDLLERYELRENEIDILLKKIGKTENEFLDGINDEYWQKLIDEYLK